MSVSEGGRVENLFVSEPSSGSERHPSKGVFRAFSYTLPVKRLYFCPFVLRLQNEDVCLLKRFKRRAIKSSAKIIFPKLHYLMVV